MTNTSSLNRSLGGAIGLIALVSLLNGGAMWAVLSQLRSATAARDRSTQVITAADGFLAAMLNQETGLRGFLLTRKEDRLEPYTVGRGALDGSLAELGRLVHGDLVQSALLAEAETAARAWQAEIAEPLLRGGTDGRAPAPLDMELAGRGKAYFDRFRARLDMMEATEKHTLAIQDGVLARAQRNAYAATGTAALLTVLICAAVGLAINRVIVVPLVRLAAAMRRLAGRELDVPVPGTGRRSEVGAMARAVEVFKNGLIELDRTSLLRATADTLPALVGYVDSDRRIGFLNGEFARWFELGAGDVAAVYGRPLAEVFAAEPFPGTAPGSTAGGELDAAFGGAETRFEYRLARRGAGGRRQMEAVYRPHRAPDGAVLGVVTLLTDITERKLMEVHLARSARDLRRSNEELEQFAYVASHDLKAPLRGIENLVGWIEEDLDGQLEGDTRTNMDLLKNRVRRLESLLDDLLAYSRAGRVEGTVDAVDTAALVAELATLVSPPEGFAVTGSPDLPTLRAFRAPLTQVLQNLINNAVKHHDHPATGHIHVSAAPAPGGFVTFTVADDGPGIAAQFRERVFGMFQTLKPRDQVEGSGMGLAIVRKLVERQGGTVWLGDGPDGRGLAVHFTWPEVATLGNEGERLDGADGEPAAGR